MIDKGTLQTGVPIPFPLAGITVHQPTYKEISRIGETQFLQSLNFLNFSKDILSDKDKSDLSEYTDFEVFMSIMNSANDIQSRITRVGCEMVLSLLFPDYNISLTENAILLIKEDEQQHFINEKIFDNFKSILSDMFKLKESKSDDYNPANAEAKRIAEKFKKRKKQLNELKKDENPQELSIYSKFISILSVGLQKDKNDLCNYTIYQLVDEFDRYQKKVQFDIYLQAKMAGAKDLEDTENWML